MLAGCTNTSWWRIYLFAIFSDQKRTLSKVMVMIMSRGHITMFSYEMGDDPNQKADHFISGDGDGDGDGDGFPHISSCLVHD